MGWPANAAWVGPAPPLARNPLHPAGIDAHDSAFAPAPGMGGGRVDAGSAAVLDVAVARQSRGRCANDPLMNMLGRQAERDTQVSPQNKLARDLLG